MKKLIAFVSAAFIFASTIFAESTLHLGMYFPITNLTIDDDEWLEEKDIYAAPLGVSLDYTNIQDSGFTWKASFAFGYGHTSDIELEGTDLPWLDIDFGAGAGYSFIHNDKMSLSLLADIGWRVQGGGLQCTLLGIKTEVDVVPSLFYVGPEVAFTYRPVKHFGVFANCGLFYATGTTDIELKVDDLKVFDASKDTYGFIVQPKFGISWTF